MRNDLRRKHVNILKYLFAAVFLNVSTRPILKGYAKINQISLSLYAIYELFNFAFNIVHPEGEFARLALAFSQQFDFHFQRYNSCFHVWTYTRLFSR